MTEEVKKKETSHKEKEITKKDHKKDSAAHGKKKTTGKNEEFIEMQQKLDELNDKYLRLYSEFDNYRKRTIKEKNELVKTASEDVIYFLLPVLDDLERAINALESSTKMDPSLSLEGIQLIYSKFNGILQQKGLEAIESVGKPFDVDFHEAVTNIPATSDDLKGKVVDEIQKGYMLNGKVIRYAKVVVGA